MAHTKSKILITLVTIIVSAAALAHPVKAQSTSVVNKIAEAKTVLQKVNLNADIKPEAGTQSYSLVRKDIALAVLNQATGKIEIAMAMQSGNTFVFPDPKFDIKLIRFNGVNTAFAVNRPANGTVLALKYLITPVEKGSLASIDSSKYSVIYVPYTDKLNTAELSAVGRNYVNDIVAQAAKELQSKTSAQNKSISVPQAVDAALVKTIIYAEHIDTTEFLRTADTTSLLNKVNVLFGGNGPDTYKYSVSSANARGLSQFIPSTYNSLVSQHPQANLIVNYVAGMENHVNAVKATYLLLDDYIADVKARTGNNANLANSNEFGAAAYNGGTVRISRAINTHGRLWAEPISNQIAALSNPDNALRQETVSYVQKVRKIFPLLTGNQNNPPPSPTVPPAPSIPSSPTSPVSTPKHMTFFTNKTTGEFWVYMTDGKHAISPFVAQQKKMTPDIAFDNSYVQSLVTSTPIIPREGTIFKGSSPAVYIVMGGVGRLLTFDAFKQRGITPSQIVIMPQAEVDGYVKGPVLTK